VMSHVEDRHHGSAAHRVGVADFGDAVKASAASPQSHNPASARSLSQVTFDLAPHLGVHVLEDVRIVRRPGDEERGQELLQPAFASVLAHGLAKRSRLDPGLELGDPLALSLGLPVHGVLKSLEQVLEVSDALLEPDHLGAIRIAGVA